MSADRFLLSRKVPASHPEWVSALPGGPAAAKDISVLETELTASCRRTHAVTGRMEEKLCTPSRDAGPFPERDISF